MRRPTVTAGQSIVKLRTSRQISSARVPLRQCRKDDPCGQVQAYGKHPVVAQASASKDGAPGMSSGENVYAIPLDLTTELLWQPVQSWSAQDAGTARFVMAVLDHEED